MWLKSRLREAIWGILCGSVAGIVFPAVRNWVVVTSGRVASDISTRAANFRAPMIVAMLAVLALIVPRFLRKTSCLFRSWKAGLVRGTSLFWAAATLFYWAERSHLYLCVLAALIFHACTDIVQSRLKRQQCSMAEIASWLPQALRRTLSTINFDKPIETWEEDAVGRSEFVQTVLTRVLVDCEPALGITADFGEGKSSVLQLIRISIERGGEAIAVPFRTWLPGNEKAFVESLFATATTAIRSKYFLPSWRSIIKNYGRAVLGVIPKSWGVLSSFLSIDSQSSQIRELTDMFSRLPIRVVFLLDEIDRMHEDELTVLLKILRGAPELANVGYICAFSKEALARVVSPGDSEYGSRYLDKFFPVQLQLPRIDDDLRESLFSDRLSAVLEEESIQPSDIAKKRFDDVRRDLWYNALDKQLTNIRLIGQFVRGFQSSFHVSKNEVNYFDLLVLEAVRQLLPATFEFVYENGRYFHEPQKGIERWNRGFLEIDEEARKTRIRAAFDGHFRGLTQPDADLARHLLSLIFPSVREYLREESKAGVLPSLRESNDERRISDPIFFPRYFTYTVPATMFGEKEMADFLSSLAKATSEGDVHAAVEQAWPAAERDDLRRIHFLRRLISRAQEVSAKHAEWLALEMAKRTSGMHSEHVVYQVIKGLVFTLVARLQGGSAFQRVIEQVVQEAGSDRFASDIVYSSVSEKSLANEVTNWDGFDSERMKKVFSDRMRAHNPKPVHAILASNFDDPLTFSRWKFYVPEDADYIEEFLRSAFDFNVENLGIFLRWLLPGNVGYQNGAIKFVSGFYPIPDIVLRLRKAEEDKVQWSAEDGSAIQRFWDFYKDESGSSAAARSQAS